MSYPMVDGARQNRILAEIPWVHYARIQEHLKPVDLSQGQVFAEAGKPLEFVYFPTSCTVSLVSHTADGDSSELAMIGKEGMVGISLILGNGSVNHRAVVQCSGQAFRMPSDIFQSELAHCRELQQLSLNYVQALITQMAQSIVCVGHHSVSERLSYWLLFNQDALGRDQLMVTHETIANMLGVRRESITQALGKLQSAGLVSSGRGRIHILDRLGLTDCVCECYGVVSTETQRLFGRVGSAPDVLALPFENQTSEAGESPTLLQKYQDAYDFAPVGFVSVNQQGRVVQTNLAGAIMLDIQRSQSTLSPFVDFMAPFDRPLFQEFHREVLSGKCRRHCELMLCATAHRPEMVVRIDATLNETGDECRLVMIDVTDEKKIAAQELAMERQLHELLVKQPLTMWFKDPQGRLISANASLLQDWRHFAEDAALEKIDGQSLPMSFPHPSGPGFAPGVAKST